MVKHAFPGQFSLFAPGQLAPPRDHDPTGLTLQEIAGWTFRNGVGILSRPERAFLFQYIHTGGRLSGKRLLELSKLHERVGSRPILLYRADRPQDGFVPGQMSVLDSVEFIAASALAHGRGRLSKAEAIFLGQVAKSDRAITPETKKRVFRLYHRITGNGRSAALPWDRKPPPPRRK